jgi:hypothetical protein
MIVMLVASQRLLKANIAKVEALENITKEDLE